MPVVKFIEHLDLEQVSGDSEIAHSWTDTKKLLTREIRRTVIWDYTIYLSMM